MKLYWTKQIVVFVTLLILVGCSTDKVDKGTQFADGATAYTLRCPDAWAGCYTSATQICGKRGFEEIDRFSAGSVSSTGRMDDRQNSRSQGSGIYKEDVRQEDYDRVLTIRCN